ncbi:hypothetical protein TWF481_001453 [Arthrobotrys musiformis]|uniref:F-box domain-containing protein n=1 Tax=Arthrobotrys musiformis TaxID=47236 RepID=A0AAV9WQK3_9PEZI
MKTFKGALQKMQAARANREAPGQPQEATAATKSETIETGPTPSTTNADDFEIRPCTPPRVAGPDSQLELEERVPHCSYCLERLCPPTCATALFLDSRTGIFFPASLYPVNDATAAPTQRFLRTTTLNERFTGYWEYQGQYYEPEYANSPDHKGKLRQKPVYKTIWCEHHRCPASLISHNSSIKNPSLGSYRFFQDHENSPWLKGQMWKGPPRDYIPEPQNELVGYRPVGSGLEPVYEPSFYDTICRTCCLPDHTYYNNHRQKMHCRCDKLERLGCKIRTAQKISKDPWAGKQRPSSMIARLTSVEVFEQTHYGDGYWNRTYRFRVLLATEFESTNLSSQSQPLGSRVFKHSDITSKHLKILRFKPVSPFVGKPKLSLQRLPTFMLDEITDLVLQITDFTDPWYLREASHLIPPTQASWLPPAPEAPLFLDLSLDIFKLIQSHLTSCDRVRLSLTTKRLRHTAENLLPQGTPGTLYEHLLPRKTNTPPSAPGFCSYCAHPLCPPTCPTALFLDYKTGIFYPASLYPVDHASPAPTKGFDKNYRCHQHFMPGDDPRPWNNSPPGRNNTQTKSTHDKETSTVYKTIWCEHHRCPPSLLSNNYDVKDAPMGAYRFNGDYYYGARWPGVRKAHSIQSNQTPPLPPEFPREYSVKGRTKPVPSIPIDEAGGESFFYDKLCRHCFLPVASSNIAEKVWAGIVCTCWKPSSGDENSGPGRCDCTVPVRFTLFKAFHPISVFSTVVPFYLAIASEIKVFRVKTATGKVKSLTIPADPEGYNRSLEIVKVGIPPRIVAGLADYSPFSDLEIVTDMQDEPAISGPVHSEDSLWW